MQLIFIGLQCITIVATAVVMADIAVVMAAVGSVNNNCGWGRDRLLETSGHSWCL